jgi:hypothetical protein
MNAHNVRAIILRAILFPLQYNNRNPVKCCLALAGHNYSRDRGKSLCSIARLGSMRTRYEPE